MKILAFETSSDVFSLALQWDAKTVLRTAAERTPNHALPLLAETLSEVGGQLIDLDLLAYGRGPGQFTGLRLGASLVQGLAWGAGLAVWGVNSLEVLVQQAPTDFCRALTCVDARAGEVYWALWEKTEHSSWRIATTATPGQTHTSAPAQLTLPSGPPCVGLGNGLALYPDLAVRLGLAATLPEARPQAQAVLQLAMERSGHEKTSPHELWLDYGRNKVALTAAERHAHQ